MNRNTFVEKLDYLISNQEFYGLKKKPLPNQDTYDLAIKIFDILNKKNKIICNVSPNSSGGLNLFYSREGYVNVGNKDPEKYLSIEILNDKSICVCFCCNKLSTMSWEVRKINLDILEEEVDNCMKFFKEEV